jgi:hypothetical protein
MLEVLLTIVLFPWIVFVSIMWLFWCIRAVKLIGEGTAKDGVKVWFEYIKAGLRMNKDFVQNGF